MKMRQLMLGRNTSPQKIQPSEDSFVESTVVTPEVTTYDTSSLEASPTEAKPTPATPQPHRSKLDKRFRRRILLTGALPVLLVLLLVGLIVGLQFSDNKDIDEGEGGSFASIENPVNSIDVSRLPQLPFDTSGQGIAEIVFNENIISNGSIVLSPILQPSFKLEYN